MPIKNPKELFVKLLSDYRQYEERLTYACKELREVAMDPSAKESLDSLLFLEDKTLATIDQCFKLIGEQPVKFNERMYDIFLEDFRKEVNEMQSPAAKLLYITAKANHLIHLRLGELGTLVAMSEISGNSGIGLLLESVLATKLTFIERTRRKIRKTIENELD
jgi:ferritin-like metal-binding protein YciE